MAALLSLSLFVAIFLPTTLCYDITRGNVQLKQAMDVAAIEAYSLGHWTTTIGKEEGVGLPFFCDWDRTKVQIPSEDKIIADGALYDVITEGRINFAYLNHTLTVMGHDGNTFEAFNVKTDPPSGIYPEWHRHLVDRLSNFYDGNIEIGYTFYHSASQALLAVNNGSAHAAITPFTLGGRYGNRNRDEVFQAGCPDHSLYHGRLYRRTSGSISSYDELRAAQAAANPNTYHIGVLHDFHCPYYQTVYYKSNVTCLHHDDMMDNLDDFDFVCHNMDGFVALDGDLPASSLYGTLYKKDDCDTTVTTDAAASLAVVSSLSSLSLISAVILAML